MEILQLFIGFIFGAILASVTTYILNQSKNKTALKSEFENEGLKKELESKSQELARLNNELVQAKMHVAAVDTENAHLIKTNEEKVKEVKDLQEKLKLEFENIANRVLTHRSKEISEQNHQKISDLLSPLKEKINRFEKKVEETYDKEVRDNLSLKEEVKRLYDLNQKISDEAGNLTKALKGDVKTMGNWGEMILERILEQSGLTKGREYRREVADINADGKSIRPDVIIDLPENKHLVIDSKLSLLAYDEYCSAQSKEDREAAIKKHRASLREHIKGLHEKKLCQRFRYQRS